MGPERSGPERSGPERGGPKRSGTDDGLKWAAPGRGEAMSEGTAWKTTGAELGTDGPGTIVVGLDDSVTSWRALAYAAGMARRQGGRIVAIYARTMAQSAYGSPFGVCPPPSDLADEVGRRLAEAVGRLAREQGVKVVFEETEGDPVAALAAAVERHHGDLIVVGASEKFAHRLFGSTAVRAVRARRCPVTVVP